MLINTLIHSSGGGGGGGGGGASIEDFGLLPNNGKAKREQDDWKSRWPTPPSEDAPSTKESDQLKTEWEKYISKDKLVLFFPKKLGSMDCGNGGIEVIHDVIQHNDDLFIDHLDLIFKWFTLRLSEREMVPTLVRMLEVINVMLENLHGRGYELYDFEAQIFIPYILEKSGSGKDRIVASFKQIMLTLSHIYNMKNYCSLLIKSLKTKNGKTQALCLSELARVVESDGVENVGSKNFSVIVKLIDAKDKDVRNAALDCIASAHQYLGDEVICFYIYNIYKLCN